MLPPSNNNDQAEGRASSDVVTLAQYRTRKPLAAPQAGLPRLVPISEIIALLGIDRSTFYRKYRDHPAFPRPVKIGRMLRYPENEIAAFYQRLIIDEREPA